MSSKIHKLTVRTVAFSDCDCLLSWRNDPDTYRWFKNPTPVHLKDQIHWLQAQLSRVPVTFWMAELEGNPVGSARLSLPNAGVGTVSVIVAADARRQGVAGFLLAHLERDATFLGYAGLKAEIHSSNFASKTTFERAGFSASKIGAFCEYEKTIYNPT